MSTLAKLKNRLSRSFSNSGNKSTPGASKTSAAVPADANSNGAAASTTTAPQNVPSSTEAAAQSATPAPAAASSTTQAKPSTAAAKAAPPAPPKDDAPPEAAAGAHLPNYSSSARSLSGPRSKLRTPYPPIEPYKTGTLKVSSETEGNHEIYWELSGKEGGYPVVFLHGGPGGGCSPSDREWFDPKHYQILTFDQRGSGKSTPAAELTANTTWHLVDDIERLRTEVAHAEKWHVFGGSWGSTLSLAYAQKHPERVSALILRGIFTLRRAELLFFYQEGTSYLWPEQHQPYYEHIPAAERGDIIAAYYKRLTSDDPEVRLAAARRWATFENATSKLYLDQQHIKKGDDDKWTLQFARIESHFFQHAGWMTDGQLLAPQNVAKIAHIPTVVVQGRYDVVCPAKTAWDLRNAWLETDQGGRTLELFIIPDAGHASKEPGIQDKLLYATDKFRAIGGGSSSHIHAGGATSSGADANGHAAAATQDTTATGTATGTATAAAPVAA